MIARKSVLPIANVAIGALLGLVALRIISQYFGPAAYGEFQFALASVGLLYIFADLSMSDAHTKRVSEGMHEGDCFVTFTVWRVASSLAFVFVMVTFLVVYTGILGRTLEDIGTWTIIGVVLYYLSKSIQSVGSATFDAKLQTARSQLGSLVETLVRVGFVILAAFAFVAVTQNAGPLAGRVASDGWLWAWIAAHPAAAIAIAWAVGSLAATVVLFAYLLRHVERGRFRWEILRSYFAFAIPLFIPNSAALIAFFIDRAMVGFFGTNVDAADFAGPRQIVSVVDGLAVAVGMVLFPAVSAAIAGGNREGARDMVDRATRYLSMIAMPLVAFLTFFPEPILNLVLSAEFTGDTMVLSVLAVTIYLLVISRPYINFLMGHGHARAAGRAGLVASVLVILLNLVFVPEDIKSLGITLFGFKALGAALATLIATTVGYVMLAAAARKLEGYRSAVAYWKHGVAGLAMAGGIFGLEVATGFSMVRWYEIIGYATVGGLVYVLALILLRELTRADWRYVQAVLHPGDLYGYVKSELGRRRK